MPAGTVKRGGKVHSPNQEFLSHVSGRFLLTFVLLRLLTVTNLCWNDFPFQLRGFVCAMPSRRVIYLARSAPIVTDSFNFSWAYPGCDGHQAP